MNYDAIREQLQAKRAELMARIGSLKNDVQKRDEPYSQDFAEQAVELENLDVLFELDEESRHELNLVNDALERLDNGEYEHCVRCGDPIGEARLNALPYAQTCIKCAQ